MSEITSDQIRRGFWIDWSEGRVLGATITTTTGTGNIVIALLAILVSLAIDHLWNLVLFAVHQLRASRSAGDAVFQQEQALIRTLPTPFLFLIDIIKITWSWGRSRGTAQGYKWATAFASLVLLFGAAAIVASTFSSFIVHTSNLRVLVAGNGCYVDYYDIPSDLTPDWYYQSLNMAQDYVDKCYNNEAATGCNIFVQPRLSLSLSNLSCPLLDKSFCVGSDPASLVIDSGLIDSNDMLGINDKPGNRIMIRRKTTYFPVRVQDQFSMLNTTQLARGLRSRPPLPGEEGFALNYGYYPGYDMPSYPNITTVYPSFYSNSTTQYTLTTMTNYSFVSSEQFIEFHLIPELYTADADTALLFIFSNIVKSQTAIDDPVFASHKIRCCTDSYSSTPYSCIDESDPDYPDCFYNADYPFGVIAARQQYQFCLADDSGNPSQCTEYLRAQSSEIDDIQRVANEAQQVTLAFLRHALYLLDLQSFIWTNQIAASRSLRSGEQTYLPRTQWMNEAYNLESTVWALIQIVTAYHVGGPSPSDLDNGYVEPNTTAQTRFCESQKVVKPGGFANINVLGLTLVVAISGLVIITDIFLLKIFVFAEHKHPLLAPRVHRWVQDGVLQLQRRAYEAAGIGPWQKTEDNEVPILVGRGQNLPTFFSASNRTSSEGMPTTLTDSQNESDDKAPVEVSVKAWCRKRAPKWSRAQPVSPVVDSSAPPLIFSNNIDDQQPPDGAAPLIFSDTANNH